MKQPETIGNRLYWCYANLAMSHAAVSHGSQKLDRRHFMIRSRLFAGLCKGTMKIGPIADDERLKLTLPQACAYCGSRERLSVDHLIPRKKGGADAGENMVWACRSCNSSKGATDALEWLSNRQQFPPLLLLRRYLKLAVDHCARNELLGLPIEASADLPFSLEALPRAFPRPDALILWTIPLETAPAS